MVTVNLQENVETYIVVKSGRVAGSHVAKNPGFHIPYPDGDRAGSNAIV